MDGNICWFKFAAIVCGEIGFMGIVTLISRWVIIKYFE